MLPDTARLCAVMFGQVSKLVFVAVVLVFAVVLIGVAVPSESDSVQALSCATDPVSEFGDGVHDVGCEISDGVYVADEFEGVCNVALTDVGGETRFSAFVGRAVINLKAGWANVPGLHTIESDGCGTWDLRDDGADVEPRDEFGAGAYEVGLEIEPGVYESSVDSERCFWFYLDDWHYSGGSETAVVVWQVGRPLVSIPEDAFGFYSVRCGTWTRRADDAGRSEVSESFGDGSYVPGLDIAPGLYASDGGMGVCEWYRTAPVSLVASDGGSGDIGGLRSAGRQVVEVKSGDVGFSASGCGEWRLVPEVGQGDGAPDKELASEFGVGTYMVGRDIAPGTYVSESVVGDRCEWSVLAGFGGSSADATRSGVGVLRGIVRVFSGDVGFYSSGCSGWRALTGLERVEPPSSFGDGEYVVGVHVSPGLYIGSGAEVGRCFWRRYSDFTGSDSDVLGIRNPVGRVVVRIVESDLGFESLGCGTWRRVEVVDNGGASAEASFGSGTWLVGSEVRPGLYSASLGADGYCFWGRFSDFTGAPEDLLAGSFAVGNALVLVDEGDAGIYSDDCGTWVLSSALPEQSPLTVFGDGVYLVGAEVVPGTYETRSIEDGLCVWSRLSGFRGTDLERIVSVASDSSGFVTVLESDLGFRSTGCETWRRLEDVGDYGEVPPAAFGDGQHVVGRDVAPGIYEATDHVSVRCEWMRLSDWSWTVGVTTERLQRGRAMVEISAEDAGFYSTGCGEWVPVEASDRDDGEPSMQFGDGAYGVGVDISAGVYRSDQQFEVGDCRWRRVSDFGGTRSGVISSGGSEDGDWIVELSADDAGFESSGCGEWTMVELGDQSVDSDASVLSEFGDGVYRVGVDVTPGVYVADIGTAEYVGGAYVPACRWSRVSGFGHEDQDVIESGVGRGELRLELDAGDAGVVSVGCGNWVRE